MTTTAAIMRDCGRSASRTRPRSGRTVVLAGFLGACFLLWLIGRQVAGAEESSGARTIYMRVDENGVLSFTDNPGRYDEWKEFIKGSSKSGSRFRDYYRNFHAWDAQIRALAKEYELDAALIKAVVMAESAFNPRARSSVGARGLMQLMPETARLVGCADIWDPIENLTGGTRYLKQMLLKFGIRRLAVAAYNAGPGAVKKYNGVPPFQETRTYVQRVESFYLEFKLNDLSFAGRK